MNIMVKSCLILYFTWLILFFKKKDVAHINHAHIEDLVDHVDHIEHVFHVDS